MNCTNCDNDSITNGVVYCDSCGIYYCDCCVHQSAGDFEKGVTIHSDVDRHGCQGKLKIYSKENWCSCCPLIIS